MGNSVRKIREKRPRFVPAIADTPDQTKAAEEILRSCSLKLRAESASIFLMQQDGESLRLVEAIGSRENHHCGESVKIGDGISGYVAVQMKPMTDARFAGLRRVVPRKDSFPVDTFMSCPVMKKRSVLAVINVAGRKAGRPFSSADLKRFQAITRECTDVVARMVACQPTYPASGNGSSKTASAEETVAGVVRQLEALRNSGNDILHYLPESILIFDNHLNPVYCSKEQAIMQLLDGGKNAEITKRSILDFPLDIAPHELKQKLDGMFSEGKPFLLRNVGFKDSGSFHLANLFFYPLLSPQGHVSGGFMLVEDVTRDFELRQRLSEVEKFSLIGSLTSMITHEVNNPLDGAIRLINISMAQMEDGNPLREYLTEAQKGLYRIASLVSSILVFSRKSMSLHDEITPLNVIIDNTISMIRNRSGGKDAVFHLELAPDNPTVRTNDFYQVFSNLLANSYDAITNGTGNIFVETRCADGNLHIMVKDDGCGIPKKLQPLIFKAFVTTKKHGQGTGLGLAITKKIVDKYGGAVEMKSEENVGTQMHLTFPINTLTV